MEDNVFRAIEQRKVSAQIVDQVRALVATRALRPGDKLPSVRELAAGLRVNRNTAAKAYQALEADGVVETRAGQGCFIADGGPRWSRAERYRRIEASEKFAADVAHELKNPLTAARSTAESLVYAKTDAQRDELVEQIQLELKRLNRLISDVSNASRLDAELVLLAGSLRALLT